MVNRGNLLPLTGANDPNQLILVYSCEGVPGGCKARRPEVNGEFPVFDISVCFVYVFSFPDSFAYLWSHSLRPSLVLCCRISFDVNWSPTSYRSLSHFLQSFKSMTMGASVALLEFAIR